LEPIKNVKYASGLSCRPLQNGRFGFPLLTQTHDDIAFAGAGLEPIKNVKYASGLSCRPLQNGRFGFPLLTQTHDDIAFAVNPFSAFSPSSL
jgi:hypothetical protein